MELPQIEIKLLHNLLHHLPGVLDKKKLGLLHPYVGDHERILVNLLGKVSSCRSNSTFISRRSIWFSFPNLLLRCEDRSKILNAAVGKQILHENQ